VRNLFSLEKSSMRSFISLPEIKVAIIGVGNCASSLVQGVAKYADAGPNDTVPGLMHPVLGEYGIGDI
jgi:myo-inositol-1-phosphate synthase